MRPETKIALNAAASLVLLLLWILLSANAVHAKDLFLFAGQSNMEGWSNWSGGADWKYLDRALFDDVADIIANSDNIVGDRSALESYLQYQFRERIYRAQRNDRVLLKSANMVAESQAHYLMILYNQGLLDNLKDPVAGATCSMWSDRYTVETPVPVSYDSMCGRMFGNELMFARSLRSKGFYDFAIHKVAVGNTKIEAFMQPSTSQLREGHNGENYWSKMRNTIYERMQNGDTWAGIVWHQGSANSEDGSHRNYEQNLQILMTDLRNEMCQTDAGCYDPSRIPIIIVQNGVWPQGAEADAIRAAQESFARSDPRAAMVSTKDLGRFYHYDATSFLISGDRIANAIEPFLVDSRHTSTTSTSYETIKYIPEKEVSLSRVDQDATSAMSEEVSKSESPFFWP